MKRSRMTKMAGWLALSLLAACDPTTDHRELEPDEPVTALVGALSTNTQADLTFSESGRGRLFAPTQATWLAVVADGGGGKVAFASGAWSGDFSRYNGIVNRVTAIGTRDNTWNPASPGNDHVLNDEVLADDMYPQALVSKDGFTYVAGWMTVPTGRRSFLIKLDARGELVDGFGHHGAIKPMPMDHEGYEITRIFITGSYIYTIGSTTKMDGTTRKSYAAVARFKLSDGSWDEAYGGGDGWAMRETRGGRIIGGMAEGKNEVVIAVNGYNSDPDRADYRVFRFDASGKYESDFGERTWTSVIDVAVAASGEVYLLSNNGGPEPRERAAHPQWQCGPERLIALKPDGTKDTEFAWRDTPNGGGGGPAGPAPADFFDEPGCADLTSTGTFSSRRVEFNERLHRIYVLGDVMIRNDDNSNTRYWGTLGFLPNGQYDTSFGSNGRLYTNFTKLESESSFDMALQTFKDNSSGFPVDREGIIMCGLGSPEHKGPLARVLIDFGHAGEPCRSVGQACFGGLVCKDEHGGRDGDIHVKTCRAAD
jgi:hypothetical protein